MLKLTRVSKEFDGVLALDQVSLEVEEGVFLYLVGPNRCGKTTLLRLIAGLDRPTGGEIWVNGRRVKEPGPDRGFVFQEYVLFPWRTVAQNIAFGLELKGLKRREQQRVVQHYLELIGLTGYADYYPASLSGGSKQLVAIGRALANDPHIILMDEPFASLDAQTRNHMQERLLDIWQRERKTILFVTHNVDEAVFLADRIAVMSPRPGRIVETVSVELPRPRVRTGGEFNSLREHILGLLTQEIQIEP